MPGTANHIAILIEADKFKSVNKLKQNDKFFYDKYNKIEVYGGMLKNDASGSEVEQRYEFPKKLFTIDEVKQLMKWWYDSENYTFVAAVNDSNDFQNAERYDEGQRYDSQMRFDVSSIPHAEVTQEGYIKADAYVTRTGVFKYLNQDGTIRGELRHPGDVFNLDSLNSMKMIPVTNGHPPERMVKADNAKRLQVGHTGELIEPHDEFIKAPLVVTDSTAVKTVKNGRKGISMGYQVDLIPERGTWDGEFYDFRQSNIRYNHLALVDNPRAGGDVRLHIDESEINVDSININQIKEGNMPFGKIVLDGGLSYEAAPEVINALNKSKEQLGSLTTKVDGLTTEAEKSKAKIDELEAENKKQKEKLDDKDAIQKAVRSRIDLEQSAAKVLKEDEVKKLSDMSDKDIKVAVIIAKNDDFKADGKTDEYIQARFDTIIENLDENEQKRKDASTENKKKLGGENTDENNLDQEASRKLYNERLKYPERFDEKGNRISKQ